MKFTLKDYQEDAVRDVLENLKDAAMFWRERGRKTAFSLAATTGAGKTVLRPSISLDTLLRDPNPKRRVRDEAQEGRVGEGARPLVGEVQA